ncbi:MAG: hypothetical protein M1825_004162 [Sarcosagium campestre]|nr:MAG: hypothetical protein M1825_004162 [Sarcosagium campestre]
MSTRRSHTAVSRPLVLFTSKIRLLIAGSTRPETEAYTSHLANLLLKNNGKFSQPLRILDVCTGSGCIPILLHSMLSPAIADLSLLGIDISADAISLARQNLSGNVRAKLLLEESLVQVDFLVADILQNCDFDVDPQKGPVASRWDILISNPPYISDWGFDHETTRSVRNWEPRLALVPNGHPNYKATDGDTFYPPLLALAANTGAKIAVFEVGGAKQAERVAAMAIKSHHWAGVQLWRDLPDQSGSTARHSSEIEGMALRCVGSGHVRTVVCYTAEGRDWIRE